MLILPHILHIYLIPTHSVTHRSHSLFPLFQCVSIFPLRLFLLSPLLLPSSHLLLDADIHTAIHMCHLSPCRGKTTFLLAVDITISMLAPQPATSPHQLCQMAVVTATFHKCGNFKSWKWPCKIGGRESNRKPCC